MSHTFKFDFLLGAGQLIFCTCRKWKRLAPPPPALWACAAAKDRLRITHVTHVIGPDQVCSHLAVTFIILRIYGNSLPGVMRLVLVCVRRTVKLVRMLILRRISVLKWSPLCHILIIHTFLDVTRCIPSTGQMNPARHEVRHCYVIVQPYLKPRACRWAPHLWWLSVRVQRLFFSAHKIVHVWCVDGDGEISDHSI